MDHPIAIAEIMTGRVFSWLLMCSQLAKVIFLMCIFSDVENVQDGIKMYHEDGRGGEEHLIKTFQ